MSKSNAVRVLGALAHEGRLEIFRYLVRLGFEGALAGAIGKRLSLSASTLSFHLSALKQAELVEARREGRTIVYTANFQTMNEMMAYLMKNCCVGSTDNADRD